LVIGRLVVIFQEVPEGIHPDANAASKSDIEPNKGSIAQWSVLRFWRRARPEIPAASIIALSPFRCERKLLANKCRVFAACEGEHFAADGIARGREDEFAAQLARGEIVALLQITHLMGGHRTAGLRQLRRLPVRAGRGTLDLAQWMFACKSTNKRHRQSAESDS